MNKKELDKYITDNYGVTAYHPFLKYPDVSAYRHADNNKWFALVMEVDRAKLGLKGEGSLDIVNLKCDFMLIRSLTEQSGVFPAYHMNKNYWVSVALDGSAEDDTLRWILDMSFNATRAKKLK